MEEQKRPTSLRVIMKQCEAEVIIAQSNKLPLLRIRCNRTDLLSPT